MQLAKPSATFGKSAPPLVRAAAAAFVVIAVTHLITQLTAADGVLADVTQILVMPALAAVLFAATAAQKPRSRLVKVVLVALFFSWLGDTLPRFLAGDAAFLTMVGCFLLAQLAYIAAFWPYHRQSLLRRPILVFPYLVAFVVLVGLCASGAGALLAPVIVYGLALTTMAVLATGLGPIAGIGGAIFLVSDSLIALDAFAGLDLPVQGFWVMLTYIVGQALLVAAVVSRAGPAARSPGTPTATRESPRAGTPSQQ